MRGLVERAEGLVEAAEAERLVKTSWQSEGKADWRIARAFRLRG